MLLELSIYRPLLESMVFTTTHGRLVNRQSVTKEIERAAKLLMPLLFTILVVLVLYSFSTPGFRQAMEFLFRPNFHELTAGGVLEALGHSFFTLPEALQCEYAPLLAPWFREAHAGKLAHLA